MSKKIKDDESKIKKILNTSQVESEVKSGTTSIEKSILNKIRK